MISLVGYFLWQRNASLEALELLGSIRTHLVCAIQELAHADENGNFEESMHSFRPRMMQGIHGPSTREVLRAASGHSEQDALYNKNCVERMRGHLTKAEEAEELSRKKGIPDFVIRYNTRNLEEKLSHARELWDGHIRALYAG